MEAIRSHRRADGKPESESRCPGLGRWLWGWRESRLRSEHHFGDEIDRTETEGPPSGSSPEATCQAPAPGSPAQTGHTAPGSEPWPYDPVTLGSRQPLPPFPNCKTGPTVLEVGGWHTPSSLLRDRALPLTCTSSPPPPLWSKNWLQTQEPVWPGCSSLSWLSYLSWIADTHPNTLNVAGKGEGAGGGTWEL